MIVVLCFVAALAIDFHINSSSASEQLYTAEYLSLAALETFSETNASYSDRVQAARTRVSDLAKESFLLGTLGLAQADDASDFGIGEGNDQAAGSIVPGTWYFDDPNCSSAGLPASINSCPCIGNTFNGPCFRPTQPSEDKANAFKVNLKTKENTKPWFSSLFGFDGASLNASATATLIPKEVVFLLDLSRSTTFDTHPPGPTGSTQGVDYNWRLEEDGLRSEFDAECPNYSPVCWNTDSSVLDQYPYVIDTNTNNGRSSSFVDPGAPYSVGDTVGYTPVYDTDADPSTNPSRGTIDISQGLCGCRADYSQTCQSYGCRATLRMTTIDDVDYYYWDVTYCTACWWVLSNLDCAFETNPTNPDGAVNLAYRYNHRVNGPSPNSTYGTTHSKTDYRCFQTQGVDLDNDNVDDRYIFDTHRSGTYEGPQPLTAIMGGVYRALQIIDARAVNGDRIGVIGFDQTMDGLESRCIGFTDRYDTNFTLMETIFQPSPSNADLQERFNHMFFPRAEANTSVPLGLSWAGYLFATEDCASIPNAASTNFTGFASQINQTDHVQRSVVLFTDGLTNCTGSACSQTDWNMHYGSLMNTVSPIATEFANNKIPIHVMMYGNSTGPHTLLRRGSASSCMTDQEAREMGLAFVDGNSNSTSNPPSAAYQNLFNLWGQQFSGANPYHLPDSYFFIGEFMHTHVSGQTRGIFGAMRPPCSYSHIGATDLNDCNTNGEGYLGAICGSQGTTAGDLVTAPYLTDSSSRLVCDPSCRDKSDQVGDFVEDIYGQSPYVLVE
jgi:hypothetical protein